MSINADDLQNLKLPDLKKLCKEKSLPSTGTKNDLITRLLDYEKQVLEAQCNEVVNEQDLLGDENGDLSLLEVVTPMPTTTKIVTDSPLKSIKPLNSPTPVETKAASVVSPPASASLNESNSKEPVIIDITIQKSAISPVSVSQLTLEERKRLREERFKLGNSSSSALGGGANGEVDKMKKRAERFGEVTNKSLQKTQEEEKLNQRSQRFGLASNSGKDTISKSELSDEERKRLRIERFSPSASGGTDSEADKKLKRAARFGGQISSNDNDDIKKQKRAERFGLLAR